MGVRAMLDRLVQFILAPDKRRYMAFRSQRLIDYKIDKHISRNQDIDKPYVDFENATINFQGIEGMQVVINNLVRIFIVIYRNHSKELEGSLAIDKKTSRLIYVRGNQLDLKNYVHITDIYRGDSFDFEAHLEL